MEYPKRQSMPPRTIAPLRLDSSKTMGGSLEISPSRSSIQSSNDQSRAHTPSSSVPSTPLISARPLSPEKGLPRLGESNTFLTALAAQERRVLELKEELQKAEVELEKLKKQWAAHEAAKKRNELRHLEQLQPLNTSLASTPAPPEEDSTRPNKELDRRKRTSSSTRSSQRTVFSGSRHTRTLSLLSPRDSVASSNSSLHCNGYTRPPLETVNDVAVPSTAHELSLSTDGSSISNTLYKGPPREMILETGKQLVGDFRQGLWTFFEDLKQVTVGDEAASTLDPRAHTNNPPGGMPKRQAMREKAVTQREGLAKKVGSSSDLHSSGAAPSDGSPATKQNLNQSAVKEKVLEERPTSMLTGISQPTNTTTHSSDSDDDGWDNWDTPTAKGSTSRMKHPLYVADPMASPLTDKSSPRTSTR